MRRARGRSARAARATGPTTPSSRPGCADVRSGEPLAWIVGRTQFGGVDAARRIPVSTSRARRPRSWRAVPPTCSVPSRHRGRSVHRQRRSRRVAAARRVRTRSSIGVDVDPAAVRCAASNGVRAVVGDLAAPLHASGVVDVITAVAPYVPTADRALLPVGRAASRTGARPRRWRRRPRCRAPRRRAHAARLLRPGGHLLLELGGEQDVALAPDLARHGFTSSESWDDDDGDLRGVVARR